MTEAEGLIRAALAAANVAVQEDHDGHYQEAADRYGEVIRALEQVLATRGLPVEVRTIVSEKLNTYKTRQQALSSFSAANQSSSSTKAKGPPPPLPGLPPRKKPPPALPLPTPTSSPTPTPTPTPAPASTLTSTTTTLPTRAPSGTVSRPHAVSASGLKPVMKAYEVIFEELPLPPKPTTPLLSAAPADTAKRPFWFMQILSKTVNDGAFVTPKLYVPRNVWYQPGLKFSAIQQKVGALESVSEAICRLQMLEPDNFSKAIKVFEEVYAEMLSIQNVLARHFSFIKETKSVEKKGLFKNIGSGISKGAGRLKTNLSAGHRDEQHFYVELIQDICERGILLGSCSFFLSFSLVFLFALLSYFPFFLLSFFILPPPFFFLFLFFPSSTFFFRSLTHSLTHSHTHTHTHTHTYTHTHYRGMVGTV
ncbi:T-cell receptor beta chain ANA 11, putative (Fragment), variant 2 [Balamuthia mandrillaris]